MILQNNPHLKIERLLGGVKPRCTKLDWNFFLWLFNVFFVDFRLAEYIYIFVYTFCLTIFTLFFLTHLTKLLKAGRREAEHPQCCRLPWTRKLVFGQKIFLKRKQIKPTACVSNQVKEKEEISARGVFEKTSRRWRTDHALGSRCCGMFSWGKYFITFVRDKDLVSPLCMSMFVSSPTFSFSSSSIAIRIVSISRDSFRLQKQDREVAKY